jgi:hypothetical protein
MCIKEVASCRPECRWEKWREIAKGKENREEGLNEKN